MASVPRVLAHPSGGDVWGVEDGRLVQDRADLGLKRGADHGRDVQCCLGRLTGTLLRIDFGALEGKKDYHGMLRWACERLEALTGAIGAMHGMEETCNNEIQTPT
jgi:hypothetical protein